MKKLLILTLISLAACSPYQRVKRIVDKHPEVLDSLVTVKYVTNIDTFIDKDTFVVPEYKDSFTIKHDTTIIKERITIRKKGDKIYIKLPADTFIQRDTIYIPVQKPVILRKGRWYDPIPFGALACISIVLLLLLLRRK